MIKLGPNASTWSIYPWIELLSSQEWT